MAQRIRISSRLLYLLLPTVVILLHSNWLTFVSAKATGAESEKSKKKKDSAVTTTREDHWLQLEEAIQASRVGQRIHAVRQQAQGRVNEFEEKIDKEKKLVKRRIERDVLHQEYGFQRFSNSVRHHVGLVLGGAVAFVGGGSGFWAETATHLQGAQLSWRVLNLHNATSLNPWIKDAAAGAVAIMAFSKTRGTKLENVTTEKIMPMLTICWSIAHSVGIILHNLDNDVTPTTTRVTQVVVAGLGTALLSLIPVPLPLVAASVAGASLVYQSVIAEVVGNWFYILEHMTPEKRSKLRHQAYHQLRKKILYPAQHAYMEIHAAFTNQTLSEPSLRDKVHKAIERSLPVKLVWSFAAVGILFQTVVRKQVENVASSARSWWVHRRSIKKNSNK